jgi:hypothetical protein
VLHGKDHMACVPGFRGFDRVVARENISCGRGESNAHTFELVIFGERHPESNVELTPT